MTLGQSLFRRCAILWLCGSEGQTLHLFHFQTLLKLTLTFPFHWSNSQSSCSGPALRPLGHLLTAFLLCLALLFIFALACIQIIHTDPSGAWKQNKKKKNGKMFLILMCLRAFLYVNIASSFKLIIDIPEQISVFFLSSSSLYGCEGLWEKLLRDWLSVSGVGTAKRCPFYCNHSCLATVPVLILFHLSLIRYCVSDVDGGVL